MASTSTMEMSNISMPDISEEDVVQMDTPGYFGNVLFLIFVILKYKYISIIKTKIDSRPDDSVLSGIGPLRTPSDASQMVTPVTGGGSVGFGLNRGNNRQEHDAIDEDTPDIIIQRR